MHKQETRQTLPQLNIIRAIASLGVAIFHLGGKTLPLFNCGWLGVEMFFVLTGFVICWSFPSHYSIKDFPIFFLKRLARVEPPYIVSILLIVLLAFILNHTKGLSFQNIIFHLAYLNNFFNNNYLSPVYWTLGIEFQFYIFIGLLFPFLFFYNYVAIFFFILINALSFYFPYSYSILLNFSAFFTLGMLIFMYKSSRLVMIEFLAFLILNIVFLYFHCGLAETLSAVTAASIIMVFSKSFPLIDFFSKISFSLYLTHDIIGSSLVVYIGTLFSEKTIFTKGLAFVTGFLISIGFAYLFYILVERSALQLSKKVKY